MSRFALLARAPTASGPAADAALRLMRWDGGQVLVPAVAGAADAALRLVRWDGGQVWLLRRRGGERCL